MLAMLGSQEILLIVVAIVFMILALVVVVAGFVGMVYVSILILRKLGLLRKS